MPLHDDVVTKVKSQMPLHDDVVTKVKSQMTLHDDVVTKNIVCVGYLKAGIIMKVYIQYCLGFAYNPK